MQLTGLEKDKIDEIVKALDYFNWNRSQELYERYLSEEEKGLRKNIVAYLNNEFAGHVSLIWQSKYSYFSDHNIPEISDLIVLPKYCRQGIGSALIARCEEIAKGKAKSIGLGVGLYKDYAPAQRLYVKRGYKLDCQGATTHFKPISPGKNVLVDDDLLIWMVKNFKQHVFIDTENKSMQFFPVEEKFKKVILGWFEKNHVKEFYYGEGLKNTLRNLDLYCQGINTNGRYSFEHWLALLDDIPFGFLMTSLLGPYDENNKLIRNRWFIEGKRTYTLDLLIGSKTFLGKGLAHIMIQNFILDKFSDADYFIIDPAKTNKKAIRVYEKAGFKKIDEFCPSYDSIPHLMMRLAVEDLKNRV